MDALALGAEKDVTNDEMPRELIVSLDPGMSEWGNPAGDTCYHIW